MATTRELLIGSLRELALIDPIDPVPPEMLQYALDTLNRLLDLWNAKGQGPYAELFSTFTLTPSLSPHTIGPSTATWPLAKRPKAILSASLIVSSVYSPITVRDAQWYAALPSPAQTGAIVTDVFYNPTTVNGSLYFWPVPTTAYQVRLQTKGILAALALEDAFTLPEGYEEALRLTVAERLAPSFGVALTAETVQHARDARSTVFGNNDTAPRLATADAGIPGACVGADYDYRRGPYR
ncbi:MAG TPA: hypothetical protein VEC57_15105 [Candidatus Limnocylindrales bacterium]|nr:hypothetical protein [Candidatus Limnocylindrales bacterium]